MTFHNKLFPDIFYFIIIIIFFFFQDTFLDKVEMFGGFCSND